MRAVAAVLGLVLFALPADAGRTHEEVESIETYEESLTGDGAAGTVDVWYVPALNANTVTVTMISDVGVTGLEIIAVSRKDLGGAARCFRPATRDTASIDTGAKSYSWPFCSATYDSIGINFADAAANVQLNITAIEWR